MRSTLILKNIGDEPTVEITLQVSYFIKINNQSQVETKEFVKTVKANQEISHEVDFDNSAIENLEVLILVQKPKGNIITQKSFTLKELVGKRQLIDFTINREIDPAIVPDPNIEPAKLRFVYGRLLDKKGSHKMEDVQIIISVKKEGAEGFEPITSVKTEAKGYFSIDYPFGNFEAAAAFVGLELLENPIPIRLDEKTIKVLNDDGVEEEKTILVFPQRAILIAELIENVVPIEDAGDCGCQANEFEDKKVLEEFSFFSLVRTSEPAIKGYILEDEDEITLEDVLKRLPFSIFEVIEPLKALPLIARTSPIASTRATTTKPARARATDDNTEFLETIKSIKINKSVLDNFLKDEKTINKGNIHDLFARNEAYLLQDIFNPKPPPPPQPLGRVTLGLDNSIDWDEKPTLYQAVEIAHGHLLQFKTEWLADGYSLGDLLYSLPLAPGQKKQIVTFGWERTERAKNTQQVDYEESLFNSLSRDRDILEIAKGTIHENVRGSSSASVGAVGGGIGGFVGVVFGVAGGYSTAKSKASQDSLRQVSSSDQQKLSDKIVQSASAVRSMRSTVIQTVSQGERFEVSSESVANYNHCHALTIQYFEVLKHFKIRQRFAGARECLFVPLLMSQFDRKKALRWREALQLTLLDKRLAAGFDAGDRVSNEWKDSNFPSGTFASEKVLTASGVLQIKFVLQRPADKFTDVEDKDRPVVVQGGMGAVVYPYTKRVAEIIPENWEKIKPLLGTLPPEQFYADYLAGASNKDAVFHRELGEKIARAFIESLEFHVENEENQSLGTVPIDASVTSRYYRDGVMRVTLRLMHETSFPRDKFHYLKIKTKLGPDVLPEGSYMTVQSGFMQYRTKHHNSFLFKYQYLGDDLTATDAVTIYAGPGDEELKDPRKEDLVVLNKLIAHLNDNLEHYHKAIWVNMTAERRFMLLDGIILNDKGEGKSIASLVENDLLTIVGNSLVFPVAPGLNLNPDFGMNESLTEFYMTAPADPISVSVPTQGVFAEAVMGKCNSCEEMEENRFWRWEESPIPDSPTSINPISTDSRRADPGNLQPQAMPNPMINIQNAPDAPAPNGLSATLGLLGQSNVFKDITGLEGNQKNAMQAFQSSLDTAKAFAQEAGKLEVQKAMEKRLDKAISAIDKDKSLTPEKKAELKEKALNAYMGGGAIKEETNKDPKAEELKQRLKTIDDLTKDGTLTPEQSKQIKDKETKNFMEKAEPKPTLKDVFSQKVKDGGAGSYESTDMQKGTSENIKVSSASPSSTASAWRYLDEQTIRTRVQELINNPNLFNQSNLSLCVLALFYHHIFQKDQPNGGKIWQFVYPLFKHGEGYLGQFKIRAGTTLRNSNYQDYLQKHPDMPPQADWMLMASLRDSENAFWDVYDGSFEDKDLDTYMSDLRDWYQETGFYKKVTYTDLGSDSLADKELKIRSLQKNSSNHIAICTKTNLFFPADSFHAFALEGPMLFNDAAGTVSFDCWTWGEQNFRTLTKPITEIVDNFCSFVIADFV